MNAEIRAHWDAVAAMGCIVTASRYDVTLHHGHGGSMCDRGFNRTFGRKTSDWLVMPLVRVLHVGPASPKAGLFPIDGADRISVKRWEAKYGKQADFLDEISRRLGVDVWAKARDEERGMLPREAA